MPRSETSPKNTMVAWVFKHQARNLGLLKPRSVEESLRCMGTSAQGQLDALKAARNLLAMSSTDDKWLPSFEDPNTPLADGSQAPLEPPAPTGDGSTADAPPPPGPPPRVRGQSSADSQRPAHRGSGTVLYLPGVVVATGAEDLPAAVTHTHTTEHPHQRHRM